VTQRLDVLLAKTHALSRRRAQDYITSGRVDVDGRTCREPGAAVAQDMRLALDVNRPAAARVRSRLVVHHEDRDIVIVEKPAGLLTLSTEAHEKDTLLSRVSAYLLHRFRRRPYVGVVHRLDKDTSGAVVFARSREMLTSLQKLFGRHEVSREYLAIVEGRVVKESGTVSLDLVADRGDRRRGTAKRGERGVPAVTHYRVLERLRGATLVALNLETGRTHQIRLHMASLGHPVLGDRVYRGRDFEAPVLEVPRQMLHARTLGFVHPGTGEPVSAESPIPDDFRQALRSLKPRPRSPSR
jgi:23S rRNA pseudouridine1911/1915/1917 synthase